MELGLSTECDANYLESFKVVTHEYWCEMHPLLHYAPDDLVFLCGKGWGHFTSDALEIECKECRIKFAERYILHDG